MKLESANARQARRDAYNRLIDHKETPATTPAPEAKQKRQPQRRMVEPTEITVKVVAA
jgi:hypothetical protein